jgi:hypothetical protein
MAKLYAIVRYSLATTSIIASVHRHFRCGFLDCRYHSSCDAPRSKNDARTASRLPSKDCVCSSACSQFHRDEIADCLDSPVYQPDEEATARRQTQRDACPENRDDAEAAVLAIEEARQGALLAWKAKRPRDFALG